MGNFHNNIKSGNGIYKYKDKTYEGFFEEGKFHGHGELKYGNGDYYLGLFKAGKK